MWKSIIILFVSFVNFGQEDFQISVKNLLKCDIFSKEKKDSSYCNYYITDFSDTVYFKHDNCLFDIQLTSPALTFKRTSLNGYAEGALRIHTQYEDSYSVEDGTFSNGISLSTYFIEYYNSGNIKTTGQYIGGQRRGVWTWYYENGQIEKIAVLEDGEIWKEMEFDLHKKLIYKYDFINERIEYSRLNK
jgi:antitoxin component YwqK of YwqJK toxin-antitoxin module